MPPIVLFLKQLNDYNNGWIYEDVHGKKKESVWLCLTRRAQGYVNLIKLAICCSHSRKLCSVHKTQQHPWISMKMHSFAVCSQCMLWAKGGMCPHLSVSICRHHLFGNWVKNEQFYQDKVSLSKGRKCFFKVEDWKSVLTTAMLNGILWSWTRFMSKC